LSNEDGGLAHDIEHLVESTEEECDYSESDSFSETESTGVREFSLDYDVSLEVTCDAENFVRVDYYYEVNRTANLIRLVWKVTLLVTGSSEMIIQCTCSKECMIIKVRKPLRWVMKIPSIPYIKGSIC